MAKFKRCPRCKKEKPVDSFYVLPKRIGGLSSYCKECARGYCAGFYATAEGKKKHYEYSKKSSQKRHPDDMRRYRLWHNYKITPEDYDDLYNAQDGCCAICGVHQKDIKGKLNVDHNHKTGEVRGLLCWDCNLGLGRFKDDSEILKKAIMYIAES